MKIFHFWRNIFAVGFGIGVVLGTMMTFEFGLNWGKYANAVGFILGVTISMEVITAFFPEAGFIGIMLYGEAMVNKKIMFLSVWMVALGTLLSTVWIMSANTWMHTPAGYAIKNGQFWPRSRIDEIRDVLDMLELDKWANQLPFGIESWLNEHGSDLFCGEKRRLLLAQALLLRPDLLL